MAAEIVIPLIVPLLCKFGSTAMQEIALIHGAEEEFAKVKNTFSALQAVLLDAERKGDQNHAVKDWLGKLEDAAYDADDLLDELSYETRRREVISKDKCAKKVRIFFSKHNQLVFRRKMVHKIKKLRQRLEGIAADKNQFHFSETIPEQYRKDGEYTHSFVSEKEVIGRDKEKEEIVKRLLEINEKQNVSVVAIVGLGGLGKTMLAQSVFNQKRVEDAFVWRLWVCISEIFDLKIIVEKVIEAATKQRPSGLGMDTLQNELRKIIDRNKYLLVMDDVWNEDGERWAELKRLLMGGAKGSKILITTRSERVAKVFEATSPYILKGLSESNSWILFKQMAFEAGEEPESLKDIGKEIANKCMGVPLVIRTVGRLLQFKTSKVEWHSFKNSELATITQQKKEIIQVLKLSYNHLPSHLKPCFAHCALYSKGHEFEKDVLVKLWVAEGFIQSQGENKCLEDVGNEYFTELVLRSIFQDVRRNNYGDVVGCKMHDLIHDLARLVAGAECFTPDSDIENVNERTRRVLYNSNSRLKWDALSTSSLKPYKLRTFFYNESCEINATRLEAHISSFTSLRILDLPRLSMRKVPSSIGMLKHLRFLNLSENTKIEGLPSSVTKLHFLQTLILKGCKSLTKLPKNMGNMVDLMFLDLSLTERIKLLPSSIAKLQKLQFLNLHGCQYLKELPRDFFNLGHLRHVNIIDCDELKGMPRGLLGLLELNKLTGLQKINLCAVDSSKPSDMDNKSGEILSIVKQDLVKFSFPSSLSNLKEIKIENCDKLKYVARFDLLENLQVLSLLDLNLMEYVDDTKDGHSSVFFPSLQSLTLWNMQKLRGWWKWSGGRSSLIPSFPCLSDLRIWNCPQMFSIPSPNSSLKTLNLSYSSPHREDDTHRAALDGSDGVGKIATFLECFQRATNLHYLSFENCRDLVKLPDWIGKLEKLEVLAIRECPNLTLLPQGIRQLSSLRKLTIRGCSRLEERCKAEIGEDWKKIAHVEYIRIGNDTYGKVEDL